MKLYSISVSPEANGSTLVSRVPTFHFSIVSDPASSATS